jgi:hypothetical protein
LYGVIGEHRSDVETLTILIRRIAGNSSIRVKRVGYNGCAELRRKGARQLENLARLGCTRFVVCHDADGPDAKPRRDDVERLITKPAGVQDCCIVIPVQEIEAWLLADLPAAKNIFTGWVPPTIANPESIASPKEYLTHLSKAGLTKPRYHHATHNVQLAEYISIDRVQGACPSFRTLFAFVRQASQN